LEDIMSWTDARVATLTELWTGGHSAAVIARKLGEVTRNAVIGKAHRLGLPGRASRARQGCHRAASVFAARRGARRPRRNHAQARTARPPRSSPVRKTHHPELGPAPVQPVTVETLAADSCRWPEGDPKLSGFHFCGRIKQAGSVPYCAHHASRACA
jgi:GcrA cell cycle regulator